MIKKLLARFEKFRLKELIFSIFLLYPLFTTFHIIILGNMSFWLDPARDLLLALDNLHKPTLIGPPSGIPGVFYGPYWIWMLSLSLLISKDPRIIVFLILTIPYFILLPYLLRKFFPEGTVWKVLFFLFAIHYSIYFTQLWNVHPAPLLFLLLVFLLIKKFQYITNKKMIKVVFFTGFVSSLILNFHLSFGIGVFLGTIIFLIINFYLIEGSFTQTFRLIKSLIVFSFGFISAFIPTIIFESRHGFNQVQSLYHAVTNSFLYNSAVVGQVGLSKMVIIELFFGKIGELTQIQGVLVYVLLFIIVSGIVSRIQSREEKKIVLLVTCYLFVILFLYLSSKNPVWNYHFIGVEVIMILLIGVVIKNVLLYRRILIVWAFVILFFNAYNYSKTFTQKPNALTSLGTKKYIVEKIFKDAEKSPFAVFSYSPSLYTYEYDYLFKWLGNDVFRNSPQGDISKAKVVYLIIPQTSKGKFLDFINYKTPTKEYKTIQEWKIADGTSIIKRAKK